MFDGTNGSQITSIPTRRVDNADRFWLGGGKRRVRHLDRVARRKRRCWGGLPLCAARDARGRELAQNVRSARRRWRQFWRRGGRHAKHGTDRPPGAILGTSDAGAAYLFDANPSSPTFGNAISAVQEPTPTSGDAFGTSVGFDTGARRGRGRPWVRERPGPRPSISISQGLRSRSPRRRLTSRRSQRLGDLQRYVHGRQPLANLTATIDWGDGSAPTVLDLPAGSYAFAAPHDYTTDPASGS